MCWSELFQFTASLLYLNVTNAAGKLKSLRKKKNRKRYIVRLSQNSSYSFPLLLLTTYPSV